MHTNFLFGQYYVFLLFLLTLGLWCLTNKKKGAGGFLYGAAFALKLYGAPFAIYFLLKRHWRALTGMIVGFAMFLTISIIIFGWSGNVYFATHILPRALRGSAGRQCPVRPAERVHAQEPALHRAIDGRCRA